MDRAVPVAAAGAAADAAPDGRAVLLFTLRQANEVPPE